MKIPTHLVSNDFIAEILDLFKVKTKHQENLLLIEDTYLSELFFLDHLLFPSIINAIWSREFFKTKL